MDTITKYKGYDIEYDVYKQGEYSVFFAGDDVMFSTLQDAMNFIDEQVEKLKEFDKKVTEYNNYLCRRVV